MNASTRLDLIDELKALEDFMETLQKIIPELWVVGLKSKVSDRIQQITHLINTRPSKSKKRRIRKRRLERNY